MRKGASLVNLAASEVQSFPRSRNLERALLRHRVHAHPTVLQERVGVVGGEGVGGGEGRVVRGGRRRRGGWRCLGADMVVEEEDFLRVDVVAQSISLQRGTTQKVSVVGGRDKKGGEGDSRSRG